MFYIKENLACVFLAAALFAGCDFLPEDSELDVDGTADDLEVPVNTTSKAGATSSDLSGINWIHGCDISSWPQTVTLSASANPPNVYLRYDVMQNWRTWPDENNVNGSCWVVFTFQGTKYASTFDYLRAGQQAKELHYIPTPQGVWRPSSGETVGFMVSGMARDGRRTVNERSNISSVQWP